MIEQKRIPDDIVERIRAHAVKTYQTTDRAAQYRDQAYVNEAVALSRYILDAEYRDHVNELVEELLPMREQTSK